MGDTNNKDDFWNTSDDSFWNKPVVSDDWLKNDTQFEKELNQATKDNPYASSSWSSTYTEPAEKRDSFWDSDPMEELSGKDESSDYEPQVSEENPYVYEGESKHDNPYTYAEETAPSAKEQPKEQLREQLDQYNPYEKNYQSFGQVYSELTGEKENILTKLKKLSKRRKLCIGFTAATVLFALFFFTMAQVDKFKAMEAILNTRVETVEVGNKFVIFGNSEVTLESSAYHVEKAAHVEGFPQDTMLVAVCCVIISENYVSDTTIQYPYLGFDYEGETLYIKASSSYSVNDYLVDTKFHNKVLSPYGEGNGITSEGYYCFMVPKGAENPRIYFEETRNIKHVDVTTKIFEKELNFNRFSKEHTESQEVE